MHTRRGFTLIELLVVIAIIGILSSVVLASVNTARARSRDTVRKSDLHQLQNALELYANNNGGNFPFTNTSLVTRDLTPLVPAYIPTLPNDPTRAGTNNNYRYESINGGYVLMAQLEILNNWCYVSTTDDAAGYTWTSTYPRC